MTVPDEVSALLRREEIALRYDIAEREPLISDYFALRRRIFCEEQRLFAVDDRDVWDDVAVPIVCVLAANGTERVLGVVRIYRESGSTWYGGRLGVDAAYRRSGKIGQRLVWKAVTTAHGRGCRKFLAVIQRQNVVFFERMHWWALGDVQAHGQPHMLMEADLLHYPADGEEAATACSPASSDRMLLSGVHPDLGSGDEAGAPGS
jgi:putative N-acetyltransferase (TIGR04045 family)